ncbi:hypothetical protein GXP70_29355 [Paenibacillus lycopersici]|uniref:Copper amine oxidase N-terminal domain-containing protein n=1 Tax=Paenibacillus lycopersici TaxID=2704462 RepID=A0A6C0G7D8_9BACL|nr:stalk domain-containing protein [Paenibacillus lycopersici]QHT63660.1 hypothetical protein GXP70_29355 [Paenibacillus lycopersici]
MAKRSLLAMMVTLLLVLPIVPAGQAEAARTYDGISGAEQKRGMAFLNDMRSHMGLAELTLDPALTKAAIDHARYADEHYTLKSANRSAEASGMKDYTGTTPSGRAAAAGYKEAGMDIQETVYMDERPYDMFDLGQHMRDLSLVHERRVIITNPDTAAGGPLQVALYPYDGMEGAMIETDGFMDPKQPLAGEGMTITVHANRSDVSGMTATLQRRAGSRTIDIPLQVTSTDGDGAYELKAQRLLRQDAVYTAHVSFRTGGETVERTWTFKTWSFQVDMVIDDMPLLSGGNSVRLDPSGRVFVPIRFLSERFGADVGWDKAAQTITIRQAGLDIRMTIGAGTAYVNGKAVALESPPKLEVYTTVVPLRFIAEAFGYEVNYREREHSVEIWTGFTDQARPPAAAS